MVPLNWFMNRRNFSVKVPRELGMVPVKLLYLRDSVFSFDNFKVLCGMVPDIEDKIMSSFVIYPRWLNSGKVPAR